MKNPIKGNVFAWEGRYWRLDQDGAALHASLEFTIADDFSLVHIGDVGVPVSALRDLLRVIDAERLDGSDKLDDKLNQIRLLNSIGTSNSLPTTSWSDSPR